MGLVQQLVLFWGRGLARLRLPVLGREPSLVTNGIANRMLLKNMFHGASSTAGPLLGRELARLWFPNFSSELFFRISLTKSWPRRYSEKTKIPAGGYLVLAGWYSEETEILARRYLEDTEILAGGYPEETEIPGGRVLGRNRNLSRRVFGTGAASCN